MIDSNTTVGNALSLVTMGDVASGLNTLVMFGAGVVFVLFIVAMFSAPRF